MFSIFRAYEVPHWWLQARNQEQIDGENQGHPGRWAILPHQGVWLQPLSFTEFLSTGAEVAVCLSEANTPFGLKKMWFSFERVLGLTWLSKGPESNYSATAHLTQVIISHANSLSISLDRANFMLKECKLFWML